MKCHICDGKAEVTIEIAHQYLIRACLFHEDKIHHEIEEAMLEAIFYVFGRLANVEYDEDKHFGICQAAVDSVLNYMPYTDSESMLEHKRRMGDGTA